MTTRNQEFGRARGGQQQYGNGTRASTTGEASGQGTQGPAPSTGEQVPHPELGTPALPEQASSSTQQRWAMIQAEFVDDPRKSVADAHHLVDDLMQRTVETLAQELNALEEQWSTGQRVSTEELRQCLQRYRAFSARLLPAAPDR